MLAERLGGGGWRLISRDGTSSGFGGSAAPPSLLFVAVGFLGEPEGRSDDSIGLMSTVGGSGTGSPIRRVTSCTESDLGPWVRNLISTSPDWRRYTRLPSWRSSGLSAVSTSRSPSIMSTEAVSADLIA